MASSLFALDLSEAPLDVVKLLIDNMDIQQRFTCALVCSEWAKAVAAVPTPTIVRHGMRNFTRLQEWLDKNGSHVETLQLHGSGVIARLPCAQLQDLLLHGVGYDDAELILDSWVWSDIAAATKLTSVQLKEVNTMSQQADVVSALIALPDLQQLTWREVICDSELELSDSRLLQRLTNVTGLEFAYVAAEVLQHLSSLTKLQHLSTQAPFAWAATDYPGLQELQGLTSLAIEGSWCYRGSQRFPACVIHLTALQQLEVQCATFPELNRLTALTALTKLQVAHLSPPPTLLHLPALQHLSLKGNSDGMSRPLLCAAHLASCTQLRCLSLCSFCLMGPGSLVASSMLQELKLQDCPLSSGGEGPAANSPWEVLLPGPGRLPHLTSLVLRYGSQEPRHTDVERLVACCSGLLELQLDFLTDEKCSSLVQLTGLQDLQVTHLYYLSVAGLRHLARLEQLTSLRLVMTLTRARSTPCSRSSCQTMWWTASTPSSTRWGTRGAKAGGSSLVVFATGVS